MAGSYLSPKQVNWDPQTESDLAQAIELELLEETHHLELKAGVPNGSSANKELAQDLAQFAIDGGLILIGVEERDEALTMAPVPLPGLCERIEQIAQTRIDPPLFVSCKEIRTAANAGIGYVLVAVPPSSRAPHMVDGKYPARGDKSRRYLSDTEVARHHQARQWTVSAAEAVLDDYIARDPVPENQRSSAHLFVVAVPTNPKLEMLLPLMDGGSASGNLMSLIGTAAVVPGASERAMSRPLITWANSFSHRADGVAMVNGLNGDRSPQNTDLERIVEVEFGEDGTLRVLNTRLSGADERGNQRILGITLPQFVRQAVNLASAVAERVGYSGAWDFGVAATGLAGLRLWRDPGFFDPPAYPTDRNEYRETTSAYSSELHQAAGAVTNRLVGRYLRTLRLNVDSEVQSFLT